MKTKTVSPEVLKDLKVNAEKTAKALGKDFSWLSFAKKQKYGYRLLANKDRQWLILEKIVSEIASSYPEYTRGELTDSLSVLVNG